MELITSDGGASRQSQEKGAIFPPNASTPVTILKEAR